MAKQIVIEYDPEKMSEDAQYVLREASRHVNIIANKLEDLQNQINNLNDSLTALTARVTTLENA